MPRPRRNYPTEFRQRMVELVRSGRKPDQLAKEFGPTAASIRNWVNQADLDEGRSGNGLTTTERKEIAKLRREIQVLQEEREILKKAAAWFAQETVSTPSKRSSS